MGYDGAGNLAWSASGLPAGTACSSDGNTTAINARKAARTYDARNRIATLSFPDLNGNQSWSYTPDGLPASVTTYNDGGASSVVNSYLYNKRRLPVSETQQVDSLTSSVGYGYDGNGHLSTLTYPDNLTVSYAPNALGQPTQAGSYATGVTYYPNGAIAGFTYGNGIVHTLTQNARGLPDRSRDANGSTPVHDDSYDYDPVGNVLAISDAVSGNRGDRDMVYDDLNRLTSATSPIFGAATYTYDVLDNLRHVTVTGGTQVRDQDYVYDQNNRLTNITAGGATVVGLGYDVQGNLANKSGVNYTFDYGNRMRAGGPETYRYDVQGRRARSSSSAGLIYSLYAQSGQLLFQRDERSGQRRQYVYLGGSLVAESDVPLAGGSATVTYQHTDALGSPVATTNSAKAVLQRSEYEPYGYLLNRPMEDGPGYTGHVTDAATGLVYMQQRYYDPEIGAFPTTDPVTPFSAGGAFNRYWYANASPYNFKDPDGRQVKTTSGACESGAVCKKETFGRSLSAAFRVVRVFTDKGKTYYMTAGGGVEIRSGSRPWRNNNPGNLRKGSAKAISTQRADAWDSSPTRSGDTVTKRLPFAVFSSYEKGRGALADTLQQVYGSNSVAETIQRFAPIGDGNDPSAYSNYILNHGGISAGATFNSLDNDQLNSAIDALQHFEGFGRGGTIDSYYYPGPF